MVKVEDITAEKEENLNRARLEKKLAEECFLGKVIKLSDNSLFIRNMGSNKLVAYKFIGLTRINVYDKLVLEQAKTFGAMYESAFNMTGDFLVETDYSK